MDLSSILILTSMVFTIHASPIMTREKLSQRNYHQQFCANLLNFNNYFYSLEDQKNVTGIPADLSIHWKTGNIFFTLISEEMRMTLQLLHPSGEFETIKVAGLGQSTTVDNLNDIVYLATDNGVYKYKEDGSVELYTALGEDVMYIAVSSDGKTMYIATWPQNRVQKITNEGQKQESFSVIPNGHGLTLDTRNNIYFVATKTSYILKSGYTIPIKIKGLPNDKMTGIFVSRSDEVFAMDENSNLYTVDPDNASAKFIGSFNVTGVNSFAMDSADNVLIGVKGAILKFNAYEKNPCKQFEMYEPAGIKPAGLDESHLGSDSDDDSTSTSTDESTSSMTTTHPTVSTVRWLFVKKERESTTTKTPPTLTTVITLPDTTSPTQTTFLSTTTQSIPETTRTPTKEHWWKFIKQWPAHLIGMTTTPIIIQPGKKGKRHNAKKRKHKKIVTTSTTTEATEEDEEE